MGKRKSQEKTKARKQARKAKLLEQLEKEVTEEKEEASDKKEDRQKEKKAKNGAIPAVTVTPEWIAELSESILEDPDSAFLMQDIAEVKKQDGGKQPKPPPKNGTRTKEGQFIPTSSGQAPRKKTSSKMTQLLKLCHPANSNEHVAQLAVLSLLAIFKDLLPSYRIRLPTDKELAVRVKKDTKKLWDYEKSLLQHYQEYLKVLEKQWTKSNKQQQQASPLAVTCMLCLCELLKSAYHFNFRSDLITAVVRAMNSSLDQVSIASCLAIEYIFANDAQGDVALEATRQVAKLISNRNFHVKPRVLSSFLALPLRVHDDEAQAAKIAAQANKKSKKKKSKAMMAIEAELAESKATVNKILLARHQSDMLQSVTLTYFKILKSEQIHKDLLPAALAGLAKFCHLINFETVQDLLAVLKELLQKIEALPLEAALNCVLTAFKTLLGPGREMKIDQKEYIQPLFQQIPRLTELAAASSADEKQSLRHVLITLQCLDSAFLKRREFQGTRVAAFLRQLLLLHSIEPQVTVPLLAFARQLLYRYATATQPLLENEADIVATGASYDPTVQDPEHANAHASSAWEVCLLQHHVHPQVAHQAKAAAALKQLDLPREEPDRLARQLQQDAQELYIPFTRHTKKHPLAPKATGEPAKKKPNIRFVTPRKDASFLSEDLEPCSIPPFCASLVVDRE